MARPNRLSGLRGTRLSGSERRMLGARFAALGYGDSGSSIDWGSILTTGITTAGQVAAVAVKPPTYSSVVNPYTGAQTITSYGAMPSTSLLGTSTSLAGVGTSLTELLSSPIVLLGGVALIAILAFKR